MGKKIVIALGGNALGNNLPEQMEAVKKTAKAMTELVRSDPEKYIPCPLSVCVAMSQGYIGYDLQNALREEMLDRGIDIGVATVLTQVEVDPADPAFSNPTKPIGAFMSKEEAETLMKERGYTVMEDARRYITEGEFAPGSMLPKVQAALKFAESKRDAPHSSPCSKRQRKASTENRSPALRRGCVAE